MNHYMEIIAAFLTGVIGPLIVQFYKTYRSIQLEKNKDHVADQMPVQKQIEFKLEKLQEKYKSDRIWITQFHNGGTFYPSGKSIQKFSMFYEILNEGISPIKMIFQNIPVSLFTNSTDHIYHHNKLCIADFKDNTIPTYGLKYTAEETGCKSAYCFAMKDIKGKFIGILCIEYVKKRVKLNPEDITDLSLESATIAGYL